MQFDQLIDRRGTNSYKWDSTTDTDMIPLWVADMDFQTAPCIIEAVQRRVAHGVFGYTRVPDAYYDATIDWFARRHEWTMQRDWIIYTSGVVPAISAIIKAMTVPGDKVLVQTPVYNCFFSSIRNNGCEMVSSSLVLATSESMSTSPSSSSSDMQTCTSDEVNRYYIIDWEDFERKASDPAVKVFLLCNPHNPAGRVWTRHELQRMGEICMKHGVFVISDEIHCEFTMPGEREVAIQTFFDEKNIKYTPFASISDEFLMHSATCTSPSKAFNIAGLQIANITVADEDIRRRVDKAININEVCDVNPFGVEALIAAYTQGEGWLVQLVQYIKGNYDYLTSFFHTHLPQYPVIMLEGTYLAWVDFSAYGKPSEVIEEELATNHHVWLNAGKMYGDDSDHFMRINMACPRTRLEEGLSRIKAAIDAR